MFNKKKKKEDKPQDKSNITGTTCVMTTKSKREVIDYKTKVSTWCCTELKNKLNKLKSRKKIYKDGIEIYISDYDISCSMKFKYCPFCGAKIETKEKV